MLRITVRSRPEELRLKLEGKLEGPWVDELETCWRREQEQSPSRRTVIDLNNVWLIDRAGKRLLCTMRQEGAQFEACGILMSELKEAGAVRIGFLTVLCLATFLPLAAQEPMKLTLSQAVQIALRENPNVLTANLNYAESQENTRMARAGLLPQASAGLNDTVRRSNLDLFLGRGFPGFSEHAGPVWDFDPNVQFSAPFLDLSLWRRWKSARENEGGARADQTAVREQVAQMVVSQYLASLRAAAEVKTAQSRVDLAKSLFDLATDQQKAGVGTRIDTLRANVEYQNEQQRLVSAQTDFKTSVNGLVRLLNLDPHQSVELTDQGAFFESPAVSGDASLEQAWKSRPEMIALAARRSAQELQIRAARAERLPRLSITGTWAEEGLSPSTVIPTYAYGASLTVPLYTGGRIGAETAEAEIELKKVDQQEHELRNRIALEVKNALAELEAARAEIDAANLGVQLAQEEVAQAQDRFRAGVANNIEVITAQDELARANDNQIDALYKYNQARADLAHSTGRMESTYAK